MLPLAAAFAKLGATSVGPAESTCHTQFDHGGMRQVNTIISHEKAAELAVAEHEEAAGKVGTNTRRYATAGMLKTDVRDVHPAGPLRAARIYTGRKNSRACRGAAKII